MKGGIPAAGPWESGWEKARSLVLPCSAGESQEIICKHQVKSSATPLVTWSPPPASLQEDVWQMGQLRPFWVLGGLSQQGMLLALQGALSQTWLPGTPWLQGTGEAHRSSQARVSAGGQDRNQICRARALAGATQQPLSRVGTSCPSEQPCTISTPSKGGTSTMKPWLFHPSFPTHAGSRRYRAWQHHFPCVWNWFCCLC